MRRPVGIREVAEEAGVSITTVSHALNAKGRLSDETRERVKEVAQRLGYQPNTVARSLAGGRSGLIGLAVAQTADGEFAIADFAYYAQLMNAAAVAAIDRGYALVLASGTKEEAWSKLWLDGMIVVDPIREDKLCAEFRDRGVPLVSTGRIPEDPEGCWIDSDHYEATPAILNHFAERGARRIALLATPPVTSYATDARKAYECWCEQHDQAPIVTIARYGLTERGGYDATLRLLRRANPPDAIYAMLDRLALGALSAAHDQGVSVPGQLQIATCTDSEEAKMTRPALTALALNPEEIGRQAIKMIAAMIEGEGPEQPQVMVETEIVQRDSTRKRVLARVPAAV